MGICMKVCLISLGCDKNLADSEIMISLLQESGHTMVEAEEDADAIVINSCCFINDAKEESINTILECARYKEDSLKYLVVAGCLAQRYPDEIREAIPEVDALVGTSAYADIVKVLEKLESNSVKYECTQEKANAFVCFRDLDYLPALSVKRGHFTGTSYAYLKIAEGCNKYCTYCVIPSIRGPFRSVPMERILEEAKALAENGIKELILVAQETTLYGIDLYGEKSLSRLLQELCKIEGPEWIRLMYCYPEELTDDLISVIRDEKKVVKYLDMPIQHASDTVLKRMGRRTNQKELREKIRKLRREIPEIVLRTSLITGFPGETESDFAELCDFVREVKFDRLGVFTYSKEEGTPAAKLKPQILQRVKRQRRDQIMRIQQEIAFERAKQRIGTVLEVQIEGAIPEEEIYVARGYMDAPNVDGYVFVKAERGKLSGTILRARVVGAKGYDLIAEEVLS